MDNPAERLLADTEKALRKLVEDGTLDIAVLCERGRRYGREFSYPRIQGLDGEVNRALVALSDRCMEKTSEMMRDAVRQAGLGEADEDSVLEWVRSSRWGEGEQERSDSYCSHLKYILEGWLAIGFARKWSSAYIASRAASDADPYTTPEWRAAFRENGWAPDIISSGGYRWGKGVPVSPAKGIALGAGAMVMSAYSHSELVGYGRSGATGYRVRRGSNYPCALCDSLCGITWPISVEVLPAHPHCVCYAEPVYDGTVDGSSLYAERLAEYERYSADPNYKDVAFDRSTLGLKATHIRHNFDPKKGWYERAAQDAGYRAGHSVILEAEDHTVLHLKNIEGSWDGKKLEIGGAENGTSSNVRNALKHCATKPNCQTAVVYLPKGEYDFGEIRSGMARYYGLRGTDQFVEFEEIVIIAGEDIIYSQ